MKELSSFNSLNAFIHLRRRQKCTVIFSYSALLLVCFGYFLLWPEWQKQTHLKNELDRVEQKWLETQTSYGLLPDHDELTESLIKIKASLSPFHHTDYDPHSLTKTVNNYLNQSGCKLVTLKNQPPKQDDLFRINQWRLQLDGNYSQILHFLILLNQSERLFVTDKFVINKENQRPQLDLTLNLYQLTYAE